MKIYRVLVVLAAFLLGGCAPNQPATAGTPKDVVQAYADAYNRRDIEAMKQTFSAGSLKMYETIAERDKTSVDKIIKGQFEAAPAELQKLEIELGREEINGDAATVETRNAKTKQAGKMICVKENGQWKLALDKFLKGVSLE